MNAKQYFRFVDQIKKNQTKFPKPKPIVVNVVSNKRHMPPLILKPPKRANNNDSNIVGQIGESTLIRIVSNNNNIENVVPDHPKADISLQQQIITDNNARFHKPGESSKAAAYFDKPLKITCANCTTHFNDRNDLTKHFPFCLRDGIIICPVCGLYFDDYFDLGAHYCTFHSIDPLLISLD